MIAYDQWLIIRLTEFLDTVLSGEQTWASRTIFETLENHLGLEKRIRKHHNIGWVNGIHKIAAVMDDDSHLRICLPCRLTNNLRLARKMPNGDGAKWFFEMLRKEEQGLVLVNQISVFENQYIAFAPNF